mgnify:CR=1 FL=1
MSDVLQVRDLRVYLDVDAGTVKAVDGVSFRIPEGRTVALVGCGVQARTQLEALRTVFKIKQVKIWGKEKKFMEDFIKSLPFSKRL